MSKHETVSTGELRAHPENSNQVSPENQEKLDASLRRIPMFKPIVVREIDEGGEIALQILGGQHRWESAQRVGIDEVPIFNLGPISDDQAKEIMLIDNARYGSDDALMLAELLESMEHIDEFSTFMPMSDTDLKSIFAASSIALEDLELPESDGSEEETVIEPAKSVKTHSIMKFKVPIGDAEKITEYLTKLMHRHGYTDDDELTNAGAALVHALFPKIGE